MPTVLMSGFTKCGVKGESQGTKVNRTGYRIAVNWGSFNERVYRKALEQIERYEKELVRIT